MVTKLVKNVLNLEENEFDMCDCKIKDLYLNDLGGLQKIVRKSEALGLQYFFNSRGFRSPEFSSDNELLTAGCSYTEGQGIDDDEHIWAALLAKKLNVKYSNIGTSGDSVGRQVRKIFAYFKEFGHPKYLVFLLPDLHRFEYPYNENLLISHKEKNKIDYEKRFIRISSFVDDGGKDPEKITKIPHAANDAINEQVRHFYNMQMFWMLQQYCESHSINFVWSTWVPEYIDLMYKLRSIDAETFKNFIDLKEENWVFSENEQRDIFYSERPFWRGDGLRGDTEINCHSEFAHIEYFHIGKDKIPGRSAHPGMHRHIHWAEGFYEGLINENNN